MNKHYLLGTLFAILLFTACNDDDLKAPVPAFLTIEDVSVKTSPGQGTNSDRITDVKVFINDNSLGSFELPTTIPIQRTGKVNLKIRAGIFNNGQSNDRDDYPFYSTYEVDTIFVPETEMKLNPEVGYFSTTIIGDPWSGEDFESGVNFDYHPNSDTSFVRTTDPADAFENASGLAYLTEDQTFFEARSPTFSRIPRDGRPIYLEFDYKSTHDFALSVYTNGQAAQTTIVFFRSRSIYTKVYVELGPVFSTLSSAINYNLAIGYQKPKGEIGKLLVDNVKLVRF